MGGQIVLIFVNSWLPLAIKIVSLVSINTAVSSFDFSYLEPYNKWLVGTANGKVIVYNRKDFNSLNQELFDELTGLAGLLLMGFNVAQAAYLQGSPLKPKLLWVSFFHRSAGTLALVASLSAATLGFYNRTVIV